MPACTEQLGSTARCARGDSASAWHGFFGWFGVLLIVIGAAFVALAIFAAAGQAAARGRG